MQIRPLTTDAEARIAARLMASSEPWLTLERTFEDSLRLLTDASREVYVAFEDDVFQGFVILNMNGVLAGYIQTIAVAHDARGSGVGTQLVKFAEERIFRESPNVFLCVSSFNTAAHRLYERLGYKLVGELADFIIAGHSEQLMRKTIGPWREFTPPEESN
jgi:ribosomal-protein-alanine N-acetyltransferase